MRTAARSPRPAVSLYTAQWLFVVVLIAVIVGVCLYALHLFNKSPIVQPDVKFTDIECTPVPPHVPDSMLADVGGWSPIGTTLDTTDPRIKPVLSELFARHPWVESVVSVDVSPGRIRVDLTYRLPVAEILLGNKRHVIDAAGILLPPVKPEYPLLAIRGIRQAPRNGVNEPYGSVQVEEAARLAAMIAPYRETWSLEPMVLEYDRLYPDLPPLVHFYTKEGTRITWGKLAEDPQGESWTKRLQRLAEHARQNKGLDGDWHWDLRNPTTILRVRKQ